MRIFIAMKLLSHCSTSLPLVITMTQGMNDNLLSLFTLMIAITIFMVLGFYVMYSYLCCFGFLFLTCRNQWRIQDLVKAGGKSGVMGDRSPPAWSWALPQPPVHFCYLKANFERFEAL